jgi:hypothetical protein
MVIQPCVHGHSEFRKGSTLPKPWHFGNSALQLVSYQPLDEDMEIAESFKRFGRVLAQFQRMGYGNRDILLDATGGTTPHAQPPGDVPSASHEIWLRSFQDDCR